MEKVRIYGKTLNTWESKDESGRMRVTQYEVSYKDYDAETGSLVGIGSEDFSPERLRKQTEERWVYTWDGVRRNKGGYRWFDARGSLHFRKSGRKQLLRLFKSRYNAELVQLR